LVDTSDTDDDGDFSLRRNVKVVVSSGLSLETKSFGFNTFVFADVLFGFLEDDTSLGDGGLLAFDGLLLEGGGFFEIGLSSLEDGFRDRG
jgi:hypothetical protein